MNTNQDKERKKYETKHNIYHDKEYLNKKSNIVIGIIITILILVGIIFLLETN